jgi:hypothetical protein
VALRAPPSPASSITLLSADNPISSPAISWLSILTTLWYLPVLLRHLYAGGVPATAAFQSTATRPSAPHTFYRPASSDAPSTWPAPHLPATLPHRRKHTSPSAPSCNTTHRYIPMTSISTQSPHNLHTMLLAFRNSTAVWNIPRLRTSVRPITSN